MRVTWLRWEDASYQRGECSLKELIPYVILETVGRLVQETETTVTLCLDFYPADEEYRYISHIPKACILERRDVDMAIDGD